MFHCKKKYIVLLFFILPLLAIGQDVQLELLTSENGLSNPTIIDLEQDDEGFFWIATANGLNRYDGRSFVHFYDDQSGNSFVDAKIEKLILIRESNLLWIFRENNLVTLLKIHSGDWETKDRIAWSKSSDYPLVSVSGNFSSVLPELEKAVNFQTLFGPENDNQYDSLTINWENIVLGFLETSQKNIWWSNTDQGFYYFDQNKNTIFDYSDKLNNLVQGTISLTGFFEDQTGILWGFTNLGLLKIKRQKNLFDTYLSEGDPYCLDGKCNIRGIAEDPSGQIYFSHYNSIHVLNPQLNTLQPLLPGQPNFNEPFDLIVFDQFLWTNSSKRVQLSNLNVSTVLSPNKAINKDVGNFMIDKRGDLWLGRSEDLWKYNARNQTFTASQLITGDDVREITFLLQGEDKDYFWLGSRENGLLKVDYSKGVVANYTPSNSGLKSNYARVMFEDQNGKLWIGTQGGLYQLDIQKNTFSRYTKEDGLPHDIINSILPEGDSCLWIGTDLGLTRFHKKDKTFINFFVEDGLPDNELARISFHKAQNGRLYFGGLNGVIAFDPQQVVMEYQQQQARSTLLLTSFIKQDAQLDTTTTAFWNSDVTEINLYHYDKSYTFEFALTDYRQPDGVYYSFKMEGYDPDWSVPSRSNSARYNNLPPDDYIFKIKARDAKGGWHPEPLTLKIKVHPPWWETGWAYLGYLIVTLGIGYLIFRFLKNRVLLKAQLESQEREAERLKELDGFKTKLYANITHEFRTPLTVILGMSSQIESNLDHIPKEEIEKNLKLIKRNGNNLLHLVNQMLDLSKLESNGMQLKWIQGDVINYLKYISESFSSYASAQEVNLIFRSNVDQLMMDYDEDKFLKIISNLLSNALKFTPKGGKVQLLVERIPADAVIVIKVSDTGVGIPKDQIQRIFERFYQSDATSHFNSGTGIGLSLTRELVKLFGGTIEVESQEGMGSTFSVALPIHQNAALKIATIVSGISKKQ